MVHLVVNPASQKYQQDYQNNAAHNDNYGLQYGLAVLAAIYNFMAYITILGYRRRVFVQQKQTSV
jgi:hypothetical protein